MQKFDFGKASAFGNGRMDFFFMKILNLFMNLSFRRRFRCADSAHVEIFSSSFRAYDALGTGTFHKRKPNRQWL